MSKATEASGDARFPATLRIKSSQEFQLVFARGKVAADDTLVMHGVRAPLQLGAEEAPSAAAGLTRLGISISKKVGSAPTRNRWKRLIREAYRTQKHRLPSGLLLVARPRKGAEPSLDQISKALLNLSRRLDRKLS